MGRPLSGQPLLQTDAALPEAAGKGRPSRNVAVTFQKHKQKINQGLKRTRERPRAAAKQLRFAFASPPVSPVCVCGAERAVPRWSPLPGGIHNPLQTVTLRLRAAPLQRPQRGCVFSHHRVKGFICC